MGTLQQVRRRWTLLGLAIVIVSALLVMFFPRPLPESDRGNPDEFFVVTPVDEFVPWGSEPVGFYVDALISEMSLEQKIRSLIITNQPGTDAASLAEYLQANQLGGFILMGSNIPESPEELSTLTAALQGSPELPRFIAIDEEGGDIVRLPYDTFAGAAQLRNEPVEATAAAFSNRSALLASVGVNLNFGIVADVSSDPGSFIYRRSFGADGLSAGKRVAAAVSSEMGNVLSTLKHFPGHGSAPGDSHVGIPASALSMEQWVSGDAVAFDYGISAGAQFVMFGHLSFPAIDEAPSSLSARWHSILREDFGFDGIIITDDMTMLEASRIPELEDPSANAIRAFQAGNDVLLYVPRADFDLNPVVNSVVAAVDSGAISHEQIDQSVARVLTHRRMLFSGATSWIPPCDARCFVWKTY